MGQITKEFAESMIKRAEEGKFSQLTQWEQKQLAIAWLGLHGHMAWPGMPQPKGTPAPEGGTRQIEEARRFREIQAIYAEEYRLRDSIKAEMKEAGERGELMMNGQCKDWHAYAAMIATREELVEALVVSPL